MRGGGGKAESFVEHSFYLTELIRAVEVVMWLVELALDQEALGSILALSKLFLGSLPF